MTLSKEDKIAILFILGLNILILVLGISVRWENETWLWNMDLISTNFLGLFFGFILGIYLGGKAEQKEIQKRDDMWIKQIEKLQKEIEEHKLKAAKKA
jgi:hypothetical protein